MTLQPSHPRVKHRWAGLIIVVIASMLLSTQAVLGSHSEVSLTGSNFEIDTDANLVLDDSAPSIDWASITESRQPDVASGSGDNSFGNGTKEDTAVPSVVSGSIPPNKSDLTTFGVYLETTAAGTRFLHLYWHRVQEPSGTTNMDFEFNQSTTPSANGVTPVRTAGDVLIQYDLSQGGTNPVLFVSRWVTSGAGSQCEASNSVPCWGTKTNLSASGNATGSINTSAIAAPNADGLGAISARTFGEATLNFTALAGGSGGGCLSFGSAYLKSRSSDSFTAALKDFIAPVPTNVSNCGTIRITKQTDPDGASGSFGFSTTGGLSPATFSKSDGQTQTYNNVLAGAYSVTEDSPGTAFSLTDITCTDNGTTTTSTDTGTRTATINLVAGDTVDCTFTNLALVYSLNIVKDASVPGGTANVAGEKISYTITVQNTGNTTLTGIVVTDPYADAGSIVRNATDVVGDEDNLLEVGETWGYTAEHTVTQAEIDSNGGGDGLLENTATADSNETGPDTDDANVPVGQSPQMNVTKTATAVDGDTEAPFLVDEAGDVITYEIKVFNTGNVTLTGVSIDDPLLSNEDCDGVAGEPYVKTGFTITVGGSLTCTGSYSVTEADIAAGGNVDTSVPPDGLNDVFRNVTTADSDQTGPDDDTEDVPVKAQPSIVTTDVVIPQDTIELSDLTTGATGVLHVELQIDGECGDADPAYEKDWDSNFPTTGDALFTGNGTYTTSNTVEVGDDATIRWCVSYTGDAHNAAIPLGDHGEVSVIDFNPFASAAIGSGLTLLVWALWSRRRREETN